MPRDVLRMMEPKWLHVGVCFVNMGGSFTLPFILETRR